jgi:hypothetical protein
MTLDFNPQTINDLVAESVYGPAGEDTHPCANAWEVSKLISGLNERLQALENLLSPEPTLTADESGSPDSKQVMPAWLANKLRLGELKVEIKRYKDANLSPPAKLLEERDDLDDNLRPFRPPSASGTLMKMVATEIKNIPSNRDLEWDIEAQVSILKVANWLKDRGYRDASGELLRETHRG